VALRLVFMGTPVFAGAALDALHAAGHDIAAVYTRQPKPGGRRGLELTPSPVHQRANALALPVRTPARLRDAAELEAFDALQADAAVVVAYGLLLPLQILEAPRFGCFNIHASLLPRWRGAAPIHRAIMAGDRETGVMVMRMDEGLDTGPIAMTTRLGIGPDETTGMLHDRLAEAGAALIANAMAALEKDRLQLVPQDVEGACYAAKIDKAEARIDWSGSAQAIHNQIRGLSPFPGAWCDMDFGGGPERVKLLESTLDTGDRKALLVPCGDGEKVAVTRLQRAGGRAVDAAVFLAGQTPMSVS
jgi:methionyl-tRNA formyltransferase